VKAARQGVALLLVKIDGISVELTLPKAAARGRRFRVDDGRMRPSRSNSTEEPIDAFDQRNGCSRVGTMGTGQQGKSRPRATQGHARQQKVERAMGIEPTRAVLPELKNKRFGAMANPKCD
jgi:hypothetical protein